MKNERDSATGKSTQTGPAPTSSFTAAPEPGASPMVDDAGALQESAVERADDAALLQEAMNAVADLPVVDATRVAKLRAAIAQGEYRIDAQRIAERMLDADPEG